MATSPKFLLKKGSKFGFISDNRFPAKSLPNIFNAASFPSS
jgi:hypothetical protein